jgi:hypothetical protein
VVEVPLVTDRIEDGHKLVARLVESGFPVTAAAWLWTTEHGQWFLYILSPLVESEGRRAAYGRVFAVLQEMSPLGIEPLDIKLPSPTDPIGKALINVRRTQPTRRDLPWGVSQLDGLTVEGAYIYPSILASRRPQSQH